jgi:glutathione peroxidase
MSNSIYDFSFNSLQGKPVAMRDFAGKVILIVNTASKCGFTPQYAGLQELHQKYKDRGLVIIGFPCNQFGGQEPGDAQEIQNNCLLNYGVTFLIAEKVEVNGPNAHPLFQYLKEALPGLLNLKDIKWNFTKFLIGPDGTPVKRFAPTDEPASLAPNIEQLLNQVS